MHMLLRGIIVLSFLVAPSSLLAEIVQCGSTWTNGSCSGIAGTSLPETDTPAQPVDRTTQDQKRALVNELSATLQDYRKTLGIKLEGSYPQHFCLEQTSTLKDCQREISRFEERLARHVDMAKERDKQDQDEAQRKKQSDPERIVIIKEDTHTVWVNGRHRRYRHRNRPRGDHHTAGSSVELTTKSANSSLSVKSRNFMDQRSKFQKNPARYLGSKTGGR